MGLIKTEKEIKILREGGQILANVRDTVADMVKPGINTQELEDKAREMIEEAGAEPAFLGYNHPQGGPDYGAALCTSINEEIVHCPPDKDRVLENGDILSIDLGVKYKNLFTDSAVTVPVGNISENIQKLLEGTRKGLHAGIKQAKPGNTLGDIGHAVQQVAEQYELGIIRDLVGHGVGHSVHEKPDVPNYGDKGTLDKLKTGMVLAIEPMFTLGGWKVRFVSDSWTVTTLDNSLSAHFEHTVAIKANGAEILTR